MGKSFTKFIYGAGKYGKLFFQWLLDMGIEIDYFVQTDEPNNREINNVPVISLKNFIEIDRDENKIVFIAINNDKVIKEIEKKILSVTHSDSIRIYNCRNFINDNLLKKNNVITSGLKQCIICGSNIDQFLPGGIEEEIYKRHHIIGGGYRENCKCPYCGASDRHRWLYYVLQKKLDISRVSGRVLHLAPESLIQKYIEQNEKIDYYTGDIVPRKAMHVTDITDMQYKDNTFDYVICNHVMEHIADEEKAVSEIKRVLKPTGKWIFSFPICTDMKTYEDKAIISPEQRLKEYGQEDHVRLYGFDFAERYEKYGLKLHIYSPKNEMDDAQIDQFGFIKDDIIIIANKRV